MFLALQCKIIRLSYYFTFFMTVIVKYQIGIRFSIELYRNSKLSMASCPPSSVLNDNGQGPGLQNPQDHGTAGPRKKLTPQKMLKTKKLKE